MNTQRSTISLFPMLLVLFLELFCDIRSAAVSTDRQIRAVGGVPGPPGQHGRNTPKKEGQETPLATTTDLTTSIFAHPSTLVKPPPAPAPTPQASMSSIAINPTSISTSTTALTLPSTSVLPESASGTAAFSLLPSSPPTTTLLIGSPSPTSPAVSYSSEAPSSPTSVTMFSSAWLTTSPTIAASIPTNIMIASPSQSPDKRNLRIVLPTVLLTAAFVFTSVLFLTRCCTRKPYLSNIRIFQRTRTLVPLPDEEVPPLVFEKSPGTINARPKPKGATPPTILAAISRKISRKLSRPDPRPHLPTETAAPLPQPSPTVASSFASRRSLFGIPLPSTARFPLFPFSPLRSHPALLRGPSEPTANVPPSPPPPTYQVSKHRVSFNRSSHVSLAASSASASSSQSSRNDDSGVTTESFSAAPARFTFGGVTDDGAVETDPVAWTASQEGSRPSMEMKKHELEDKDETNSVDRT